MQTVMHPPDEFACEVRPDRGSVVVRPAGALDLRSRVRGLGNVERAVALTGTEVLFGVVAAEGHR